MSATEKATAPSRPVHHLRTTCRACGEERLARFLELGPQPLANANLRSISEAKSEGWYPLDVYLCESCSLVQLADVIDPEVLFRHYLYVTGTSETIAAHNRRYAETVGSLLHLGAKDLVAEIASNDGSLLKCFRDLGVRTLGIEPATNIAEMARKDGIETVNEFFDADAGARLRARFGAARAVIGNNVLAHVDDTQGFLRGARDLIDETGLVITEVPYAREMLERLEYDTVYHEHLCYFSVTALLRLCEASGLVVTRVDRVPVHGGSLRMYAGRREHYRSHAPDVIAMAAEEGRIGLTSLARWRKFAADVAAQRSSLVGLIESLRSKGKSIAGYGAPAKGNTLLNYCRIGTGLLEFTVDRNPLKQGTLTPGAHIPVFGVETLLERQPDYVVILAWNFADEIMRQQAEYARRGGRFIIPIPDPHIVELPSSL